MSKIVWDFNDVFAGKIIIKRGLRSMRKKEDKPIPIKIVEQFKHIKITKKKKGEEPESIQINIKNANVDNFQVEVNDSPIEDPYIFKPSDPNWEKIKIGISYKRQNGGKKVDNGCGDPDTTVTIGDAKPGAPPGDKKKKG